MGVMRAIAGVAALLFLATGTVRAEDQPPAKVDSLPLALSNDFQFRKTKIYSLGKRPSAVATSTSKKFKPSGGSPAQAAVAEASLNFEAAYRNFGTVTTLDQRERAGEYFDFFWRARRNADVTVRFEYRQEELRSFVQARELHYPSARGNHESEFAILGDDFFDDGRVIAWRCLLIEKGRIVAEKRSYLWR